MSVTGFGITTHPERSGVAVSLAALSFSSDIHIKETLQGE